MSVSAEVYGTYNQKQHFIPPIHAKDPLEISKIRTYLNESVLFDGCLPSTLNTIILALELKRFSKDDIVI